MLAWQRDRAGAATVPAATAPGTVPDSAVGGGFVERSGAAGETLGMLGGDVSAAGSYVERHPLALWSAGSQDVQANFRPRENPVELLSQIVGRANRLAIELDDRVSRLEARKRGRSAGDHLVQIGPFHARGEIRFALPSRPGRIRLAQEASSSAPPSMIGSLVGRTVPVARRGRHDRHGRGAKLIGHPETHRER